MSEGQSRTPAELSPSQRTLAASQADLTRALAERDEAIAEAERLFARVHELIKEADGWRAASAELQRKVQQTEAELVSARAELDILRRGGAT